ncbi:hypothetical protein SSP531S_20400 [Streptomyces spongiicola]|uniref:Uncharacterized protein n=1 Tax=Streptomyces spongiicola TaxID=1690221 RepID=A0A388SXM9_9ACTN|nr:hypothetical protein SSP531S_20400 [Streptomyces spongiicola]
MNTTPELANNPFAIALSLCTEDQLDLRPALWQDARPQLHGAAGSAENTQVEPLVETNSTPLQAS